MGYKTWQTYEEVSRYLIDKFKKHFGLECVEGKQTIHGNRSGTEWEIDAKGVKCGSGEMFVIMECRRYTSRQKQEQLAALVYRIIDTGATGGIIVTLVGIQEGAKKVADAEGIIEVTLNADCSPSEYSMRFLNKVMVGVEEKIQFRESVRLVVQDENGNVIKDRIYK